VTLIEDAKQSAAGLVNLLADKFPCFRDEGTFERKKVRFLKRAQILVADIWAAFEGEGYGEFEDIDKITMFAGTQYDMLLPQESVLMKSRLPSPTNASLTRRNVVLSATRKQNQEIRRDRVGRFVGNANTRSTSSDSSLE
jgi:hypothetical protein